MDDMRTIPCRIKSFKELIIYHDRMTSNSNIFYQYVREKYSEEISSYK